jgi:hypothetical protein
MSHDRRWLAAAGAQLNRRQTLDFATHTCAQGRIAVITVAESFDRQSLEELLRAKFPRLQVKGYQEVLHATPSLGESSGDGALGCRRAL